MRSLRSSRSNKLNQATQERGPSSSTTSDQNQGYTDTREQYPAAAKPIYLRLKGLHRKKLSVASNIKIMEGKLSKNCYPTSLDFKFNVNSTRNPILKDKWIRAIRNCKTEITLALIDDMQKAYNQTKATIAKELVDLETILNPAQFKEIKDSLTTRFKQMAPVYLEKKEGQYKKTKLGPSKGFKGNRKLPQPKGQKFDPKMNKLMNTQKALLK